MNVKENPSKMGKKLSSSVVESECEPGIAVDSDDGCENPSSSLIPDMEGRRLVDVPYVLKQYESFSRHNWMCEGSYSYQEEIQFGFSSSLLYSCNKCQTSKMLLLDRGTHMSMLCAAVNAGVQRSKVKMLFSLLDVPIAAGAQSHVKRKLNKSQQELFNNSVQNCRLCLCKILSHPTPCKDLADEIYNCCNIKILKSDKLRFMCRGCVDNVKMTTDFKITCIKSNELLKQNYSTTNSVESTDAIIAMDSIDVKIELENEDVKLEELFHQNIESTIDDLDKSVADLYDKEPCVPETKNSNEDYSCQNCPMICFGEKELVAHYESHQKNCIESMLCTVPNCNKICFKSLDLKRHMQQEHMIMYNSLRQKLCHYCGKLIGNLSQLRTHVENVHEFQPQPTICELCGKELMSVFKLKCHLADKHTPLKQCPKCDKKFVKKKLSMHLKQVHLERDKYSCPYCDKKLGNPYNMRTHIRTHTGELPFSCPDCDMNFSHSVTMKQHRLQVHNVNMFDRPPAEVFAQMRGKYRRKNNI